MNDRKALALYMAHPFNAKLRELEVPEGASLLDMVDDLDLTRGEIRHLKIHVGPDEIPWQNWHVVRPKPGAGVTIASVPQGGDTVRLIATIAIIAAAAYAGDYYNAYATASTLGTTAAGTYITVAVTFAGPMVGGPLIPPPEQTP